MKTDIPDVINVENYRHYMVADASVFVDGVKVTLCTAFNIKEGWADVYKKDTNGLVRIEGEPVTERLYGKITAEGWYE